MDKIFPLAEVINLNALLNLDDIEQAATQVASEKAWSYYYSATDDSLPLDSPVAVRLHRRRRLSHQNQLPRPQSQPPRFTFRQLPKPGSGIRQARPALQRRVRAFGVVQLISNTASQSPEEIVANAGPDQVLGWQMSVQGGPECERGYISAYQ
ncbi:hypothetical protein N7468_008633 [Penicillium chermesinum]|uniref:Uncharacterized protein n=1 Tax=Penicillium chermesinum TaxID=63820 RepID=A0A9W9TII6_9EURO|nr:uncharacterized protein N7468_008633 [Penicillium chermesinum]KAJ5224091.1 hypothetical protein N7468_008633 [Penicillium chermesinum]